MVSLVGAVITVLAVAFLATPAHAHQPVILGSDDRTPRSGPLLPDGTVSYAVRATVTKGQERGFRFALKDGDRLTAQLLIFDQAPVNALEPNLLPQVTIIDPKGRRIVLSVTEQTRFYEPYSKQAYLFVSRIERSAVSGTYRVVIGGRSSTPVDATVAVGYREVPGRVIE